MGLVSNRQEFLYELSLRPGVNAQAALLHDHVLFLEEFTDDGIAETVGLHQHPQFHFVRWKADNILCRVPACVSVETRTAGELVHLFILVVNQVLLCILLGLFESGLQIFEAGLVGVLAFSLLYLYRLEKLVDFVQDLGLGLVIRCAYRFGAFKCQVLEKVCQTRYARYFVNRTDVGVGVEGDDRGLVAFKNKEFMDALESFSETKAILSDQRT